MNSFISSSFARAALIAILTVSVLVSGCIGLVGEEPMCADIEFFAKGRQEPYLVIPPGEYRALIQDARLREFGRCFHKGFTVRSTVSATAPGASYRAHTDIAMTYVVRRGAWSGTLPASSSLLTYKEKTSDYSHFYVLEKGPSPYYLLESPWNGTSHMDVKLRADDLRHIGGTSDMDATFSIFIRNGGPDPFSVHEYTIVLSYSHLELILLF